MQWFRLIPFCLCFSMLACCLGCSATGMTQDDVDAQVALWKGAVSAIQEAGVENAYVSLSAKLKPGGGYWKVGLELVPPLDVSLNVFTLVNPQTEQPR